LQSYEVGFHLLPLPKMSVRADSQSGAPSGSAPSQGKGNNWRMDVCLPKYGIYRFSPVLK